MRKISLAYRWREEIAAEGASMTAALQRIALRIWCAMPTQWLKSWRAAK
jgi:hypothetical protein